MAKRKRLAPAEPALTGPLETKAAKNGWVGIRPSAPPIADMAGAASATAALEDLAQELEDARSEGRMVVSVQLDQIDARYLVRDRTALDEEDMQTLMRSIAARGQQSPIEVVALEGGRYGLISGWRRLSALERLHGETGEGQYSHIKCLLRSPEGAPEAYKAMVEENEIRAPLSFYERAHIAARAAEQGVFEDTRAAVKALFAAIPAPKRSKITAFGVLYRHLDADLRFGAEIPEHLGLGLVKALEGQDGFAARIRAALRKADVSSGVEERAVLEQTLKGASGTVPGKVDPGEAVASGVYLQTVRGRLVLSGDAVDQTFEADLRAWLSAR